MVAVSMSTQTTDWCRICTLPTVAKPRRGGKFAVHCARCGEYQVDELPARCFEWTREQTANASGYLREHSAYRLLSTAEAEFLQNLRTPAVGDKAEKLLRAMARFYPVAGQEIVLPSFLSIDLAQLASRADRPTAKHRGLELESLEKKFRWLSWAWAQSEEELLYLVFDYLRDASGHVAGERLRGTPDEHTAAVIKITPAGWHALQTGRAQSTFIAVATAPKLRMEAVWSEVIVPAIEEAGYRPTRAEGQDEKGMGDAAIARIRRCCLLVVDVTWARETAYYEAGLANGLGLPVIWTVRDHQAQETQGDIGQYGPLVWSEQDLPAFHDALRDRIEATIGRGNRHRRS